MYYGLKDISPTAQTVWLYMEFLARTFASTQTIKNYICGVRLLHKLLGLSVPDSLQSFELSLMLRALDRSLKHTPGEIGVFTNLPSFSASMPFYARVNWPPKIQHHLIPADIHAVLTCFSIHLALCYYSNGPRQDKHFQNSS